MNSITKNQLAAVLLTTDIFMLFCFQGSLSLWSASGFMLGIAAQGLLALPLVIFADGGGKTEKWAEIFYLACIVLWGGYLLCRLWNACDTIFVPYETTGGLKGHLLITGMISLVCLYISSTGMKSVSRSSVIAAGIGVIFLAVNLISSVKRQNFGNITASFGGRGFVDGLFLCFSMSGSIIVGAVLAPLVHDNCRSGAKLYFSLRTALSAAVLITTLLVTGGIMSITDFPVITAAQLSQPFTRQRIDSLFMILFAIFAVFSVTSQVMTGSYLLGEIFPKFRKWRSTAMIFIIIAAAVLLSGMSVYGVFTAFLTLTAEFAVPLVMLIRRRKR
ncbi:MAG: hypothetical protein MJ100_03200 [Ruminococcus sp.]|nr:hypothetical protein [Ruminococcus sp.]